MNAAGIDVSSRKSTVAVLRPFGEVVKLPFDIIHSVEGFASLVQQLKSIEGETRIVMEHTGRYYEPVAQILHEAGFHVSAVNPLLIKEYGGNSLRRVKTDKADAMKIARYALDNWGELRDYTPMDTIRYDLKTLNRQFSWHPNRKQHPPTTSLHYLSSHSLVSANASTVRCVRMELRNGWILSTPSGTLTALEKKA